MKLATPFIFCFVFWIAVCQTVYSQNGTKSDVNSPLTDSVPVVVKKAPSQITADSSAKNQKPVSDSTTKVNSGRLDEINAKLTTLLGQSDKDFIGRLTLNKMDIPVYSLENYLQLKSKSKPYVKNNRIFLRKLRKGKETDRHYHIIDWFKSTEPIPSATIDSVELNVVDGVIEHIRVTTIDGRIFENLSDIPLRGFDVFAAHNLIYNVRNRNEFVKINDFILFLPRPDQDLLPDDDAVVLNADNRDEMLSASVDLNSNLDVRIFTDLLGLFDKQGNGLIQTEVRSKIFINVIPNFSHLNFYMFNYIEPSLQYSKFDSKYNAVRIHDTIVPYSVKGSERLLMNQYAYLNLGLKINLFRFRLGQLSVELNGGLTYSFVDLKLSDSSRLYPNNMIGMYIETKGSILKSRHFGLNYAVRALFQRIAGTGIPVADKSYYAYLNPEISLFYYPGRTKNDGIFARFYTVTNVGDHSYPLLQLGYSSKLSLSKKR